MAAQESPKYIVKHVGTHNRGRPDDLFITCNSFEERCLGVPKGFDPAYRTRYSCFFRFERNPDEEDSFERDREQNYRRLWQSLEEHTLEKVIPIFCNRQKVDDGIGQFRRLFDEYLLPQDCTVVTIDMTCFTKLYLFELLYFLAEERGFHNLQVVYNQAKAYGSAKLTKGISKIFYIPHFAGDFLPGRETVLIAFLGFETERALGIWEHYEPFRTIVVLSDPPLRKGYLERAEELNSFLVSRPAVIRRTMNPYDPFEVAEGLEELYRERCTDRGDEVYNVAVISLGTKVQALGLFLFWRRHKNVRITYAFPQRYGVGYSSRKSGENFAFPLELGGTPAYDSVGGNR